MTDLEMKEAALELLFAGHGTTASAACTVLQCLAKKPQVGHHVVKEFPVSMSGGILKGQGFFNPWSKGIFYLPRPEQDLPPYL